MFGAKPAKETPFQEMLVWARATVPQVRQFSDRCYALAGSPTAPEGHTAKLRRLAEAAAAFADAVSRTEDF